MWGILDINNRGDVLIERQLVEFASPAPLIIKKNDKETALFECPGTINETFGAGINNHRDIVGACNGRSPIGFVANPQSGSFTLLAVPGALTTWGTGINDLGQVVGFYANPVEPPFCCFLPPRHLHSFFWDRATGEYRTIDNPLAELVGGWTRLTGINNKGQIVGHYNTLRNVPSEEFQFITTTGHSLPWNFRAPTKLISRGLTTTVRSSAGIVTAPAAPGAYFFSTAASTSQSAYRFRLMHRGPTARPPELPHLAI
jgi:hypothetical protein